ncbi:MAG: hypothetical protein O3A63_14620, partial [Proteobacteria bacterium]|nr:hypothetical protein [Pseudomonadota bacterium]
MIDLHLRSVTGNATRHLVFNAPDAFTFFSGQYVGFEVSGLNLPLSIASAPWRLPDLHFYYRSTPEDPAARAFDIALETT